MEPGGGGTGSVITLANGQNGPFDIRAACSVEGSVEARFFRKHLTRDDCRYFAEELNSHNLADLQIFPCLMFARNYPFIRTSLIIFPLDANCLKACGLPEWIPCPVGDMPPGDL